MHFDKIDSIFPKQFFGGRGIFISQEILTFLSNLDKKEILKCWTFPWNGYCEFRTTLNRNWSSTENISVIILNQYWSSYTDTGNPFIIMFCCGPIKALNGLAAHFSIPGAIHWYSIITIVILSMQVKYSGPSTWRGKISHYSHTKRKLH